MSSPVFGSSTAANTSGGKRRWAVASGVILAPVMSIILNIESCVDSWVIVRNLLRVFIAGASAGDGSISSKIGVLDCITLGDGVFVCTLGDGVVTCTLGACAFICTLGGWAGVGIVWLELWPVLGIGDIVSTSSTSSLIGSGGSGSPLDGCASWVARAKICWRRVKPCSFRLSRACAGMFALIAFARFVVAATMVSAGVTVGLEMYLCLKNMVADTLVDLDFGDQ